MAAIHAIPPMALRSMLAASRADPRDRLIAPVSDSRYSTMSGMIPTALAVLRVAAEIEPDEAEVVRWYHTTRIAELGYLTAEQLVALGRAPIVIGFLRSVMSGERG